MTSMPLAHAHDALGDQVSCFHNDCLRRGITELPPREWVEEFRSWLDGYEFERQYVETLKWLGEIEEQTRHRVVPVKRAENDG